MIRQAHTYLAGAVSGTALIAVAIVAFVLLVSTQAIRDWPLGGLGFAGGDPADVSPQDTGVADLVRASPRGSADAHTPAKANDAGGAGSAGDDPRQGSGALAGGSVPGATNTSSPSPDTPVSNRPGGGSNGGGSGSGGGDAPAGSASNPASGGGGSGGGGESQPGGSVGGGGGGPTSSPSETITGTVNDTVAGVDTVTGGAVGGTGVTDVTESVVEGTVGPESTVGQTVDKAAETVGGVLGAGR